MQITAKGDEVSLLGMMEALQSGRHEAEYFPKADPLKPNHRLEWAASPGSRLRGAGRERHIPLLS